jgi:hypothetical protein
MVKTLLTLLAAVHVVLLELVGVAAIAWACGLLAGRPGVLIVIGVASLLKAIEADLSRKP